MNFLAILSGVLVTVLGSVIILGMGLLISRGPLKASNQVLRLTLNDYKEAAALHDSQRLDLTNQLTLVTQHLVTAEAKIKELSNTITQMAVDNTALRSRVADLEKTNTLPQAPTARSRRAPRNIP